MTLNGDREIERCYREIAAVEAELLAGHPDIEGLTLALSDWSAELRMVQAESMKGLDKEKPPGLGPAAEGLRGNVKL